MNAQGACLPPTARTYSQLASLFRPPTHAPGGRGQLWWAVYLAVTTRGQGRTGLADSSACSSLGNSEAKQEWDSTFPGEPTFIVDLEIKEHQGLLFCLRVGEALVQDSEGAGPLQLEVTGLTGAVI